jgi:hypothetical protein
MLMHTQASLVPRCRSSCEPNAPFLMRQASTFFLHHECLTSETMATIPIPDHRLERGETFDELINMDVNDTDAYTGIACASMPFFMRTKRSVPHASSIHVLLTSRILPTPWSDLPVPNTLRARIEIKLDMVLCAAA